MKQLAALVIAVVVVLWVRAIGGPVTSGTAGAALAIGFTLLGAWVAGDVLRRFRLPRLSGYLLFGVLIGPNLGDVITETMAVQLHFVTGIATTLIALIAGLTLNLDRLSQQFKAIARLTIWTLAISMAGIAAVVWIAWPWLSIAPNATGLERVAIVTLLVLITVSFSPIVAQLDGCFGALNKVPGRVLVRGHTDDQPLSSLRYQDNFQLSRERAVSVANLLKPSIDNPSRLEVNGAGSSEPRYTPESTPENRARNRRVEIVHVRGT